MLVLSQYQDVFGHPKLYIYIYIALLITVFWAHFAHQSLHHFTMDFQTLKQQNFVEKKLVIPQRFFPRKLQDDAKFLFTKSCFFQPHDLWSLPDTHEIHGTGIFTLFTCSLLDGIYTKFYGSGW